MDVTINSKAGDFSSYFVKNKSQPNSPGIILIHEIWGLNDNIRSIADRFNKIGYSVLAPDLVSSAGITERVGQELLERMNNPDQRDEAQKELREFFAPINSPDFAKSTTEKLKACFNYLQEQGSQKIAIIGFCFGGTYAFALAAEEPDLKAVLPFYGRAPEDDQIAKINCPVLAFYGEQDTNLINDLPRLKQAMQKYPKNFEAVVYPGVGHAFFNEQNIRMYNKEAADKAWEKMINFLSDILRP